MTTLLIAFLISWALGLLLTPVVRRLGLVWGVLDQPSDRKVHAGPIPRIGGVSIVLAHILGLLLTVFLGTKISNLLEFSPQLLALWLGGLLVFGVGLSDDFRQLSAKYKFLMQILAASAAFWGGIAIEPGKLSNVFPVLDSDVACYLLTVFWFVLLINAMNLIDGLDGLAGGIALFVCLVLTFLQIIGEDYLLALYFVTLAGSVAGFLRYNFNPATVFMGDGGSYYLGYMIAGLSILGSVKSQVGVTLTLPLLAMGIPIFDTVFAPVRRIILGRAPFQPDRHHLHHKLMAKGMSSKNVVLILYSATALLCVTALIVVNLQDEKSGLLLVLLGVGVVVALNGFGYFRYIDRERVGVWLRDVGFVTGIHRDRRRFLDVQVRMGGCQDFAELWGVVGEGLYLLDFDYCEMRLLDDDKQTARVLKWKHPDSEVDFSASGLFKLEMPLKDEHEKILGDIWLVKDLQRSSLTHYTLTRIEHMRRTILSLLSVWRK